MIMWLRVWLRRRLWLWWCISVLLAGASSVMLGCLLAGYRMAFGYQLVLAAVPEINVWLVFAVTMKAHGLRAIVTQVLSKDVEEWPMFRAGSL